MTQAFKLNTQLDKDTHLLIEDENFLILLHKNATIPWVIIVPITDVIEIFELPNDVQKSLKTLTKQIAAFFKEEYSTEKMNIAAIGNIVSQLHIHVIGRKAGDACWPDVVWGNNYAFKKYSQEQIDSVALSLA